MGGGRQKIASMVPYLVKTLRKQPLSPTTNHTLPSLRSLVFSSTFFFLVSFLQFFLDSVNVVDPAKLSVASTDLGTCCRRTFSLYDQINLIDSVPDDQLRFQGYSDTGFTINGTKYEGSLLIVENKIMTWAPKKFSDITPQSLSIFQIVRPVPEILILGCGRSIMPVDPELRRFIRSTGMKLEAVDSSTLSLLRICTTML